MNSLVLGLTARKIAHPDPSVKRILEKESPEIRPTTRLKRLYYRDSQVAVGAVSMDRETGLVAEFVAIALPY